ncbi:M48 family metallopeptidase [Desulfosudis oleivorans]|nr:M48 family metallopeptidase [Desulfosudis oleivorans]
MITIHGTWYDGSTSLQRPAVLTVLPTGAARVGTADSDSPLLEQHRLTARVSDRLAHTPRVLTFPGGASFETQDNVAVDTVVKTYLKPHWSLWVHLLESRLRYVLPAVILVILVMAATIRYGVPAAADLIASHLPASAYSLADRQALKALDRIAFKPSELPPDTEARVRGSMQDCVDAHGAYDITLVFKKGGPLGPNALALPGGTIIFTDELVEVAEHDEELTAILAHEVGHVVHRHGMRRMVQSSLLSFAAMVLTGDASGVSEIFLGLPVVLTELAYSREFENTADQYALDYLKSAGIPPARFADILTRIDKTSRHEAENGKTSWTGYLSTHPPTPERVKMFLQENGPVAQEDAPL